MGKRGKIGILLDRSEIILSDRSEIILLDYSKLIPSNPPIVKWHVLFTTDCLNLCLSNDLEDIAVFLSWKCEIFIISFILSAAFIRKFLLQRHQLTIINFSARKIRISHLSQMSDAWFIQINQGPPPPIPYCDTKGWT